MMVQPDAAWDEYPEWRNLKEPRRTMTAELSRLRSPIAVQAALDEFIHLGRSAFLARYGYGKSRDFLVRDPKSGNLCDSKAIAGVAFGNQFPQEGPLEASDFSGGEATVVPRLQNLGFEVVRIGEDWSAEEVEAAVASYFAMLALEAKQERYNKSAFNSELRPKLRGRSKSSVELKHQNISAVMQSLELPYIQGYKPRGNAQLLLRKAVHRYVLENSAAMRQVVDSLEEVKLPHERSFKAVLVEPPTVEKVLITESGLPRTRLPRKVDFAARDESNRKLGRAGEQWVIDFEQQRLAGEGLAPLFDRLDWVSDRLGDGAGFDILSFDLADKPRYIEVKTTNGSYASSFIISRNELDFSREAGDAFFLYRVFQFRESPGLYMLRGDVSSKVHLEAMDFRASFRKISS
jgi:hypothetical protein